MHPEAQPLLIGNTWGFPYLAVFATAFLAGYLIPAPEEVIFVLLGYSAVFQDVNILLVMAAAVLGIVVADNISYWLGRKGSALVGRFERFVGAHVVEKYKTKINRYASKTIFTARFIPTIRVLVPVLAGTLKIKWKTFFVYDFLAAVVDVGALISIGYIFESDISRVLSGVQTTRHILSLVSLAIIGTIISLVIRSIFLKNGNGK